MEFELGLWRSTLGDTHPHHAFAVEMDWWPQSSHATELRYEEAAVSRLVGGLIGCFSGGGGGSRQALFRKDLVPLLDAAAERWRSKRPASLAEQIDTFLAETQRGFDILENPPFHDDFVASAAMLAFDGHSAAVASTGLDRVFRVRGGELERVSPRLSLLDQGDLAGRTHVPDHMARLLGGMPAAFLGAGDKASATGPRWGVREVAVEPGDTLLVLSGVYHEHVDEHVLAEALAHARPMISMPEQAGAVGEYLSRPTAWSAPPDVARARDIRWRVVSRASLAMVRVTSSNSAA